MQKLETIAAGGVACDDVVIILDTLKKFVDVIDKRKSKAFLKILRTVTLKGATVCLLGHTNKYAGEDGKQMFEGTADLRNDVDELIYLDPFKDEETNTLEITTRPDKVRATFSPKSYVIHLGEDRKVTEPGVVIKILDKRDHGLLALVKAAIGAGCHSQKEILEWVGRETPHGDKAIRKVLRAATEGPNAEIACSKTGRGKDWFVRITRRWPPA